MDLEIIKGKIKVEWSDLGEGLSGDYDPNDPNDIPLLRFDVSRMEDFPKDGRNMDWEAIDDASYCTNFPVTASDDLKMKALAYLMGEIYEPAEAGNSIKKLCERLSWISPEWLM